MTTGEVELIDEYDQYILDHNVKQPFSSIEYKPYGLYAFDRMRRFKRHILAEDKGLGKTSQGIGVVKWFDAYPAIILTTKRGLRTYIKETKKWFPEDLDKIQIVHGSRGKRGQQWGNPTAQTFVTTYASLLADAGLRKGEFAIKDSNLPLWVWNETKAWILDEFHRVIRNRNSSTFKLLQALTRRPQVEVVIPMSGSAVSKGPQDLWPALNLCDPKWWSSYWKYVGMFCIIDDTGFGKTIRGPKNVEAWRKAIDSCLTFIPKRKVSKHLPPKVRQPLEYELEPWQRTLYEGLINDQLAELPDGEFIVALSGLAALYKARLALICPKALDPQLGYGAGIEAIVDEMEESEIRRYVIYTPFRAPIPHLQDYLKTRGLSSWVLQGGVTIDQQDQYIDEWSRSQDAVMICTIKYAESFELAPHAEYCIFLGYEWEGEENAQAEDRLHRLTSESPIFCLYCQCDNTYDHDLWELIMEKNFNVQVLLHNSTLVKRLLREGTDAIIDMTKVQAHNSPETE